MATPTQPRYFDKLQDAENILAGISSSSYSLIRQLDDAYQYAPDSKTQRIAIRKAMTPMYRECFSLCRASLSEVHSDIKSRIALKDSPSSFRDYSCYSAHFANALWLQGRQKWYDTFLMPNSDCVTSYGGKSKTGFDLGFSAFAEGNAIKLRELVNSNSRYRLQEIRPSNRQSAMGTLLHAIRDAIDAVEYFKSVPSTTTPTTTPEPATMPTTTTTPDFSALNGGNFANLIRHLHEEFGRDAKQCISDLKMLPNVNVPVLQSVAKVMESSGEPIEEMFTGEPDELVTCEKEAVTWLQSQYGAVTEAVIDEPAPASTAKYNVAVPDSFKGILNSAMTAVGLPDIQDLLSDANAAHVEIAELNAKIAKMGVSTPRTSMKVSATGKLPSGKTTWIPAIKALNHKGIKPPTVWAKMFEFEVPFFEWESDHQDVPVFDPDYQWRWDIMAKLLWGLANNQKPWVHGHTGTGKTTLIEQAASIMNWPFVRINFDSEITRMDLIGRDTLKTDEHGNTSSVFADGVLPQHLTQPYIICNDELDFVRSDIAYVYQRALEDKGLLLTEDAGRLVQPHEYSRMVATANTQGQGDEFGLYQGARVQSQAFLDRFQCWIEVPYLEAESEKTLLTARVPALSADLADRVIKYVQEHREAFKQAAILKPISPRGVVSMGSALTFFTQYHPDESVAMRMALEATVLGSVTHADAAKINELIDRCFN